MPHTARVGEMKLEAPPRYSGKKQPSVRTWYSQMERYMRLMKYAVTWGGKGPLAPHGTGDPSGSNSRERVLTKHHNVSQIR